MKIYWFINAIFWILIVVYAEISDISLTDAELNRCVIWIVGSLLGYSILDRIDKKEEK